MASSKEDLYDFNHPKRGLALLICNAHFEACDSRNNAGKDMLDLKNVLQKELEFTVQEEHDICLEQLKDILKEALQADSTYNHKQCDCFMLVISSHGSSEHAGSSIQDYVACTDANLPVAAIVDIIDSCKELDGKPKLLIIQACRGCKSDEVRTTLGETSQKPTSTGGSDVTAGNEDILLPYECSIPYELPLKRNFLLAYSTSPGCRSFRVKETGSPFLQALCNRIRSHGTTTDFLTVLRMVNAEVSANFETCCEGGTDAPTDRRVRKVMPWVASMLTKDVVFTKKTLVARK